MQVFAEFGHAFDELIFRRDERVVFKVVNQVLLAMLSKEVVLDLFRRWSPFEIVERLRGLYLRPARPRIHDSLYYILVVAQQQDVLVQLRRAPLFVQRQQIILRFNFALGLQLLSDLLLLGTWLPDWSRLVALVPVRPSHPLQALQLLVCVQLVVVLIFLFLLLLFLSLLLAVFARPLVFPISTALCRRLPLRVSLPVLSDVRVLIGLLQLLRGPVAADVRHGLELALLGQLLLLLLLGLESEALGRSLELVLVDHEEVARAPLGEVWLSQDVLHSCDRADLAFVIDVLQLVHVVGLVYNAIALLKVNQLVARQSLLRRSDLLLLRGGTCLLSSLLAGISSVLSQLLL